MKVLRVLIRLGVMLLGMIALVILLGVVQTVVHVAHFSQAAVGLVLAGAGIAIYIAWIRLVERRDVDELALRALAPEGLFGLALGIVLFGTTIGLLALAGAFRLIGFGDWSALWSGLLIAFGIAVTEELLFRGFLFRTVRNIGGTWIAVGVSAVLFGLLHAFNPGATVTSSIAIALEAGVLLAVAYAATDSLWLPIGLHTGWNYAEGWIFGTAVSGNTMPHAVLRGRLEGPALLTGGVFGPEATIVAVVVCMLAAAGFVVVILRRERFVSDGVMVADPSTSSG